MYLKLTDRVIVDHDGFSMYGGEGEQRMFSQLTDFFGPVGDLLSSFTTKEVPVLGGGFDDIYVDFDHVPPYKEFTELQAQLCPSTVNCCVLRTKKWFVVTVPNLHPVEWSTAAFKHLVLEDSIKEMLKGLVEQHKKNKSLKRIMSDVIPSKGEVTQPAASNLSFRAYWV